MACVSACSACPDEGLFSSRSSSPRLEENQPKSNGWKNGRDATYEFFIVVSGVLAEPDLTVLTLAYQSTNPVLVYHPDVTLANGVYLVGHSNGTRVFSQTIWASHRCRLGGMGLGGRDGLVMYKADGWDEASSENSGRMDDARVRSGPSRETEWDARGGRERMRRGWREESSKVE